MSFFKSGPSLEEGDSTILKGSENEGTVSNCNFSCIEANDCKLQVSNCAYSTLKLLACKIKTSNCSYANIQGESSSICASNCPHLLMDALENGEFILEDNRNLSWHGKDGLGEIKEDEYTVVNGAQNQLKSSNNLHLSVKGDRNKVASVKSQHLDIEGNDNEVISSNTHYVTVEGDHNNVMVEDTPNDGMRHSLSRVSGIGENELTLHSSKCAGDPDIKLTEMNWGGGMRFPCIINSAPQMFVNGVRISLSDRFNVKLNYKDEASIFGNTYTSGIFQFQLNKLSKDKAQVVFSKDDMDKYEAKKMERTGSVVIISGEKDGKVEKLTLIGRVVEAKSETEFKVSFN